jgi:GNAT superfamily N-acetyltransferase
LIDSSDRGFFVVLENSAPSLLHIMFGLLESDDAPLAFDQSSLQSTPLSEEQHAFVTQCVSEIVDNLQPGTFQYGHVLDRFNSVIEKLHADDNNGWTLAHSPCLLRQYIKPADYQHQSSAVEIRPLSVEHADLVWQHWPYRSKRPVSSIRTLLIHRRSAAAYIDNQPVCWALEQAYGGIGMLHTLESHRRQGLASMVVDWFAQQLPHPFCYVVCSNDASNSMFERAHFKATAKMSWIFQTPVVAQ